MTHHAQAPMSAFHHLSLPFCLLYDVSHGTFDEPIVVLFDRFPVRRTAVESTKSKCAQSLEILTMSFRIQFPTDILLDPHLLPY